MVYEYHVERISLNEGDAKLQESLNKRGREGWELVAVASASSHQAANIYIFRRQLTV